MKNFNFKKLFSLFTVFTLSLGLLSMVGCDKEIKNNSTIDLTANDITIVNDISQGITLHTLSATISETESGKCIQETLKAEVTAGVGADKTLNWSVAWANEGVSDNIANYVTVEPTVVGGNYATVSCYKNFEDFGEVIVTVSSKVNPEVYATCVVVYLGSPKTFKVVNSFSPTSDYSSFDNRAFVTCGSTYIFDLLLENDLEVGSTYLNNYLVDIKIINDVDEDGLQSFVALKCEYWGTDGNTYTETVERIGSEIGQNFYLSNGDLVTGTSYFADVNRYWSYDIDYKNQKLTFEFNDMANKIFNGTNGQANYGGLSVPRSGYKATLQNYRLNFKITITEPISGLSQSLYVLCFGGVA
ncbi:MAG: hypothetical protein IKT32_03630 [Clostridia bacterium]|nr:hypothetical protein [Clostridia bacterium]